METPDRTNWTLVFALLVAGLFAAAQFGKLTLTLPVLRQTYGGGGAFVPALISIVGVVGILLGAVSGAVVTRIGLTRALMGALVGGAALSMMQASLPGLWVFAGLRVLEGLSHLCIVVAAPTLMAQVASERDRSLVMGVWAAFFGIAMAALAVLLSVLLPLGGLSAVFVFHGAGMAVIAVLLWPLLPEARIAEPQPQPRPQPEPQPRPQPRPLSYFGAHHQIYTSPNLLIPGAGFVWYTVLYIALLAVVPVALDLPVWAITGLPLISIAGTLLGGVLGRGLLPGQLVSVGFLLTLLATALTSALGGEIWPLFVLFFVMALIPAGAFAAIPHFNETVADRARATGGIAQLGNVGTTFGTPIFVLAFEGAGMGAVWGLVAGFCVLGLVSTRLLLARVK